MSRFRIDMDVDRILLGVLIISILGFGLTMVVFEFLRVTPELRAPKFTLVSFTLQGLNVSASTQRVGGNWGARFRVRSKGFDLDYDDMESTVYYNGELLSRAAILPFGQPARNHTLVDVHYSAINPSVGLRDAIVSPDTASKLTADLARGSAGFDVRLIGRIDCSVAEQQRLQVLCGVVPVTVSEDGSSGSYNDGPRKCKVILDDLPN